MVPSVFCVLVCVVALSPELVWGEKYDGYYDLSAQDTGYLCSMMDDYKRTGKQPDIINNPSSDFPPEKFLRKESNNECWKMRWNPCDKTDLTKTKPCGWYKMQSAPKSECP